MAVHSGEIVNLTIKVDRGVLDLARHRALLDHRSVNRHLADALEDYADGMVDAARRTLSAAHVFGVVEESRRLRRQRKKFQQPRLELMPRVDVLLRRLPDRDELDE